MKSSNYHLVLFNTKTNNILYHDFNSKKYEIFYYVSQYTQKLHTLAYLGEKEKKTKNKNKKQLKAYFLKYPLTNFQVNKVLLTRNQFSSHS